MARTSLMVGLPEAGKTTFLAALWHVVDTREVPGSLVLDKLHSDREYVQRLRDSWVKFKPVDRTRAGSISPVSMLLKEPNGSDSQEVVFPDVSGEAFTAQLTDRSMRRDIVNLVQSAQGVLIFIRPRSIRPGTRIDEVDKILGKAEIESENLEKPVETPWDSSLVPTQVQLVELLQFIDVTGSETNYRVGVVVSAWDQVLPSKKTPTAWLSSELPLLAQYLEANVVRHPYKIFGVSAQGGSLEKDLVALAKHHKQSERIIVDCGDGKATNDITLPIRWLLS